MSVTFDWNFKQGAARADRTYYEEGDGPERLDLVEDASGYLPEETQDSG